MKVISSLKKKIKIILYTFLTKILLTIPSEIIKNIFDFLKLDYTENWITEISKDIERKTSEIKTTEDKNLYLIGGDILNQTIDNSYTP